MGYTLQCKIDAPIAGRQTQCGIDRMQTLQQQQSAGTLLKVCPRFVALVLCCWHNCSQLKKVIGPTAWHRDNGTEAEALRRQTPDKTVAI